MISYHLAKDSCSAAYARGFKTADIDDLPRICRGIAGFVWSPCIWRDGVRKQENFQRADWCVLDFDDGEMTLEQAKSTFCDTIHIIGTTKSHQVAKRDSAACDRFRVLMLFEQPILRLKDYRYTMRKILRRYPVDQAPKDGARFFFPCKEIVQCSDTGYTEPTHEAPEWFECPRRERSQAYRNAGIVPPFVRQRLIAPIPVGTRNTTWYWVAIELRRVGFDPEDILVMIIKSPTYGGLVSPDLVVELEECVRNGCRVVDREVEDIGRGETEC